MSWDFSTESDFQSELQWALEFVKTEIEPLDLLLPGLEYTPPTPDVAKIVQPLKDKVREHGLWGYHLPPHLGGSGGSAVRLALLNAVLGRSAWAPIIFGTQAPDTGNAEILAKFGSIQQKERYLRPLLAGEIFSCYSMTEPQGGADPGVFTTQAVRDGGDWVINGLKFFSSNARTASFFIVMTVTDKSEPIYSGMSMFLVEADAPGLEVVSDFGLGGDPVGTGHHGLVRYTDVRVGPDAMLGGEGEAFKVAQTRLGGGRLHHAMRTVGLCQRAFEMLCERVLSRQTKGQALGELQIVRDHVAEAWQALHQFRLQVMHAAWVVDQGDEVAARQAIAAVKFAAPRALQEVVSRTIQVHGALGISNQLPLWRWLQQVYVLSLADGPVEVHKLNLAKSVLRGHSASPGEWPSELIDSRLQDARQRHFGWDSSG